MNSNDGAESPGRENRKPITRRSVLKTGLATSLGLGVFGSETADAVRINTVPSAEKLAPKMDPADIPRYEDEMPRPPVAQPVGTKDGRPYYELEIDETTQTVLPSSIDLKTTVWGYNSQGNQAGTLYPGPTLKTQHNRRIYAKFPNRINAGKYPDNPEGVPDTAEWAPHLLPLGGTIHGAYIKNEGPDGSTFDPADYGKEQVPPVRTTTHVHGGNVPSDSDGLPEQWYSLDYQSTGDTFETRVHRYPNRQKASTLWYHDHALGTTRLNVYAGLAGFFITHGEQEKKLPLPSGQYDVPILIQDRGFRENGEWHYTDADLWPPGLGGDPGDVPGYNPWPLEYFGDVAVVNGKAWPKMTVEPRKYRLRFLNGSNARYYNLRLEAENGTDAPDLHLIGTDTGLKEQPTTIAQPAQRLWSAPAERHEVVVDFSGFGGQTFTVTNNAAAPVGAKGSRTDTAGGGLQEIMQFQVKDTTVDDPREIPSKMRNINDIKNTVQTRKQVLGEMDDRWGRKLLSLNGKRWDNPDMAEPQLGTSETWDFVNPHADAHAMHVHLVSFQVEGRRPFDVQHYKETIQADKPEDTGYVGGDIQYTGPWQEPDVGERGEKDTVTAYPGMVTRVKMRFQNFPGRYVWHCHMLEHEDYEMMRPYRVVTQ